MEAKQEQIKKLINQIATTIPEITEEQINQTIYKYQNDSRSMEDITKELKESADRILNNYYIKIRNKNIEAGTAESNINEIIKSIDILKENNILQNNLFIYGGTVPYLITSQKPKRYIEDIDTYANIFDMENIRNEIYSNPEQYKVIFDTLNETGEDYGLEIKVGNTEISVFPVIQNEQSMNIRNFQIKNLDQKVILKDTVFSDLNFEELKTSTTLNNQNINIIKPEWTYITKVKSGRKKDQMDCVVLKDCINKKELDYINSKMRNIPEVYTKEVTMTKDSIKTR